MFNIFTHLFCMPRSINCDILCMRSGCPLPLPCDYNKLISIWHRVNESFLFLGSRLMLRIRLVSRAAECDAGGTLYACVCVSSEECQAYVLIMNCQPEELPPLGMSASVDEIGDKR